MVQIPHQYQNQKYLLESHYLYIKFVLTNDVKAVASAEHFGDVLPKAPIKLLSENGSQSIKLMKNNSKFIYYLIHELKRR